MPKTYPYVNTFNAGEIQVKNFVTGVPNTLVSLAEKDVGLNTNLP